MYTRLFFSFGVILGFFLSLVMPVAAKSPSFELSLLQIETTSGIYKYTVELAENARQKSYGLQFREKLEPGTGMLFNFKRNSVINMWMKNTLISLDMIFILENGRIQYVAEGTTPKSLNIVTSGQKAWAVLEVAAGTASRLGLKAGDLVKHDIFANQTYK